MRPHKYPGVVIKVLEGIRFGGEDGNKIDERKNAQASANGSYINKRYVGLCVQIDPVQPQYSEGKRKGKHGSDGLFSFFGMGRQGIG